VRCIAETDAKLLVALTGAVLLGIRCVESEEAAVAEAEAEADEDADAEAEAEAQVDVGTSFED
jgi:hypothetical protein